LIDDIALVEARLKADRPTLGICLGAQIMARALGAKVYPGPAKEIGWAPLTLSDAGKQSSLRFLDARETPVLHWHGDTFDLPDGATLLASTDFAPHQAFSWGKNALGVQFHPEVTALGLERWFVGHTAEISTTPGVDVPQLRADTSKYAAGLERQGRQFFDAWLEIIL
jgi:GMP synthase (glutamine-hydrolysing)